MSVLQLFSNNGVSLLNADLTAYDLTITLQPGTGQHFPRPLSPGEFFLVTLEDLASPSIREIIKITGRTGDILFIDPLGRGYEQTITRHWVANDTLVDHRVTAETMRQAFLHPEPSGSSANPLITADENNTLTSSTAKLNFVGAGVTATASGDNVTINIPGGSSTGGNPLAIADESNVLTTAATKINFSGAGVVATNIGSEINVTIPGSSGGGGGLVSTDPIVVERGWTVPIIDITYSDFKRNNKFWVTVYDAASGFAETFEVLTIIQGHLSANNEIVTWAKTNRIGYNFNGNISLTLDQSVNKLTLSWINNEPATDVIVTIIHI
jgi:hypothetical protein